MKDKRGVDRGKCSLCQCKEFILDSTGIPCGDCGHPPTKHQNLEKTNVTSTKVEFDGQVTTPKRMKPLEPDIYRDEDAVSDKNTCLYQGCTADSTFDINTGESSIYCEAHKDMQKSQAQHSKQ